MQVRWTSAATDDLENIANYLFEKTPENAAHLIREIYNAPSTLKSFVYQVRGAAVHIVRILHSSQDWPR